MDKLDIRNPYVRNAIWFLVFRENKNKNRNNNNKKKNKNRENRENREKVIL